MPRPSHSSQFYHRHNIGWGVRIMKPFLSPQPEEAPCRGDRDPLTPWHILSLHNQNAKRKVQ
jgi:hypothetical protein